MGNNNPWPLIQTDTAAHGLGNISVTITSSFLAVQGAGAPCVVQLTHELGTNKEESNTLHGRDGRGRSKREGKVRIESLFIRAANTWDEKSARTFFERNARKRTTGWRAVNVDAARRYLAESERCRNAANVSSLATHTHMVPE